MSLPKEIMPDEPFQLTRTVIQNMLQMLVRNFYRELNRTNPRGPVVLSYCKSMVKLAKLFERTGGK